MVVCPSPQFSADEVASQLGMAEPVAIHNGVDQAFFAAVPATDAELADLGVFRPFVLHAGGCSERKNLAGLAAAWPRSSGRPGPTPGWSWWARPTTAGTGCSPPWPERSGPAGWTT